MVRLFFGRELSVEKAEWGHGAFTKALLEGLREQRADYNKKRSGGNQRTGSLYYGTSQKTNGRGATSHHRDSQNLAEFSPGGSVITLFSRRKTEEILAASGQPDKAIETNCTRLTSAFKKEK